MKSFTFAKKIAQSLEYRWARSSSDRFTRWLRKKGCKIGQGVQWHGLRDISIDTTRPSLIEIGNNVCFTRGCTILTHGFDWFVLKNLYNEVIASSGKVSIGNNVFIGLRSVILKGVTIGSNCIIGACSVIKKDIPSGYVVAGNPAITICSIEDYYRKRKQVFIEEAKAYARSIKDDLGRDPVPADFWEEFPLFLKRNDLPPEIPVKRQLGSAYDYYSKHHEPLFDSFERFLAEAGVVVTGTKEEKL